MSSRLQPKTVVHDEPPAPQLSEPSVDPQLLWPSIKYGERGIENQDVHSFPDVQDVHDRHAKVNNDMKLIAFEDAVIGAEVHILVLDPHFDTTGFNVLEAAISISQARDVRLLTGRGRIEKEKRERLRKQLTKGLNENRVDLPQVEVLWEATLDKRSFPFLHDRFAIVDGGLWHFGSTVGGGHRGLTAVSGPWSVIKTRAKEFFDECWRLCRV